MLRSVARARQRDASRPTCKPIAGDAQSSTLCASRTLKAANDKQQTKTHRIQQPNATTKTRQPQKMKEDSSRDRLRRSGRARRKRSYVHKGIMVRPKTDQGQMPVRPKYRPERSECIMVRPPLPDTLCSLIPNQLRVSSGWHRYTKSQHTVTRRRGRSQAATLPKRSNARRQPASDPAEKEHRCRISNSVRLSRGYFAHSRSVAPTHIA